MNSKLLQKCGVVAIALILFCGCVSHQPERKNNNYLDDKVIAARVSQKLHSQQDNPFANVNVTVTNGVVELSGTVKSPEEKWRAAELANQINTATSARNEISVKP
ncbi:MAG TPA: BON domain-containing protein [Verrucomicrobiae bacterium]